MLTANELAHIEANPYKADFPLFAKHPAIHYLDSAATAQRPRVVIDALTNFYETYNANALRGLYALSVQTTQLIEEARLTIASFIGVPTATRDEKNQALREIAFCRNTSEALNLLAHSLSEYVGLASGDEVVISIEEHHSNLIPWQQVCKKTGATLKFLRPSTESWMLEDQLEEVITDKTKIVSLTQVSNVLGCKNDVARAAQIAHAHGAYLIVDGAQSVPHIPVNVSELDCDFLAFSAHKLGGPFGIGVLWGKAALMDALPPFLTGGEMIDAVTEAGATWAPSPEKFEAGTQDAAGIVATAAAITYLSEKNMATLEAREELLTRYLVDELSNLPFIEIVGSRDGSSRVSAVSFNVKGVHPHDVASILDASQVCIRAGHHCAEPLLKWLDISSTCRASVAFYNDRADIDALIAALKTVWGIFNGSNESL